MLKYVDSKVVFAEIPNEITLAINISNCPCNCIGCHSSYLAQDIGEPLNLDNLTKLIKANKGITCVAFMGGDASPATIDAYASIIKYRYPKLKVAWYSGRDYISEDINLENFDYIKYGHYDKDKGPLSSKTTNQVMLEISVVHNRIFKKDITSKFQNVMY